MAIELKDVRCEESYGINIDGKPIEVIVGGNLDKCTFFVHRILLQQSSSFLRAALSRRWKEGKTRVVKLPEEDGEVFGFYVQWLYTGRIACTNKGSDYPNGFGLLARLYVLGEKLMDPSLQNCIIDASVIAVRGPLGGFPTRDTVKTIYDGTPVGSPARRLMVDLHTMYADGTSIYSETNPPHRSDFLMDLATSLLNKRTVPDKVIKGYCELEEGAPVSYYTTDIENANSGVTAELQPEKTSEGWKAV